MLEYLESAGAWTIAIAAVLGALIGSFLNVVILRLPKRLMWRWRHDAREMLESESAEAAAAAAATGDPGAAESAPGKLSAPPDLVFEPSHCPKCGHALAPWENIPLVSFALLRGKCRACRTPISWQYPLVEAATAAAFALCLWRFGVDWTVLVAFAFSAVLIAATVIDLRTQLLPDQLTLPLLWLGLLAATQGLFVPPVAAIIGATIGYLSLWSVYWLFKLVTGKEGMGYGDFKLLAALGAFVGPWGLLPIILLASLTGAVVGTIALASQGKDRSTPIPFGPFLAAGGWLQFLFGETFAQWFPALFLHL